MQDNSSPIAIFDSGVGGLSIYQELKHQLPNENFVYLADQKNIPYGGRSSSEIRALTLRCLKFLVNPNSPIYKIPNTKYNPPKLIVVACNTSTVSGIDYYRKELPLVPIIGVVPVVKTAAETTKNGRIAILSTVATANSEYQKKLIEKFCVGYEINPNISKSSGRDAQLRVSTKNNGNTVGNNKIVLNIGCPNLVNFIEHGITDSPEIEKELVQILKPVIAARCDTLVLGCTHYPFLRKTITSLLCHSRESGNPGSNSQFQIPNFQILDSSGAISRQATRILEKNNLFSKSPTPYSLLPTSSLFLTTGNPQKFQEVIKKLIKIEAHVKQISIQNLTKPKKSFILN